MGILSASCSFTRFKITEPVPKELWMEILFMNHFTLTFDLHLEPMTPYALAASMLDEKTLARLDDLEPTSFV